MKKRLNNDADLLANEILDYSRNKLLVNLRFMDMALSYHKRVSYKGSVATDGKTLLYDPGFVLRLYKESQEETVRTYLHMVLHCVFSVCSTITFLARAARFCPEI